MSDLLQQVLHHLEGEESVTLNCQTAGGTKTIKQKTFGPDRWIERVHERGIMTALDCIALIFFVLDDFNEEEQARRIADGWAAELRSAALSGEISARDPFTILALGTLPDGWDWCVSIADADRFLAARGMEWKCDEIVEHIYRECKASIDNLRFPPELFTVADKLTGESDGLPQATPANGEPILRTDTQANTDESLAALFDPVTVAALEKMFPANGKWDSWAERASRNGLAGARHGRAMFNPYRAALWFLQQGITGWELARCNRVLANNLPVRSRDGKHLLTGELE